MAVRDNEKIQRLSTLVRKMKTSDKLPGLEVNNGWAMPDKKDYTFGDLIQELEVRASEAM